MSKGPGGLYVLPPIKYHRSPNQSGRVWHPRPIGIVVHTPQGGYDGAIQTLCSTVPPPADRVSAHLVVREDGNEVTQLVAFNEKAWHARIGNDPFIGIEVCPATDHVSENCWRSVARICGYLCGHFGFPDWWNVKHGGVTEPGICRHKDLGTAGGGHVDPITRVVGDAPPPSWLWFISLVQREVKRGGYLPHYGRDVDW